MKNSFIFLTFCFIAILFLTKDNQAGAQSLQFNAVNTFQYSLSGFGNASSTYTVPAGKVAKVVDAAGTNFCFQIGTNSSGYGSAKFVLNGFEIPSLANSLCSGSTNNTLYKVPLDQWMKAGDTFQMKLPNLGWGSPGTPSASYLLTVLEYNIVP